MLVRLLDGTDYDGFNTDLELIAGFADEATALIHTHAQAEAALDRALADQDAPRARWTMVAPIETSLPREHINAQVERVALTQFKVKDDTGFGVERIVFMVLHIRAPEIIGPELFEAIGWEFELRQFLIRQGDDRDNA